jgi:hypothetical protein
MVVIAKNSPFPWGTVLFRLEKTPREKSNSNGKWQRSNGKWEHV